MNAWWQLWPLQFTKSECERIQEHAANINPVKAIVGKGEHASHNENIRRSEVRWMQRTDRRLDFLFDKIWNCVHKSNDHAFGFILSDFYDVQHTTYPANNNGHYDWHEDIFWTDGRPSCRKVSVVIQLSEPGSYDGGKLELANDPLPDGKFVNQGDMIIFPSFNRHRVTPVTKGVRNSLVTWVNGPNFR